MFLKKIAFLLTAISLTCLIVLPVQAAPIQQGVPSLRLYETTVAFSGHEWVAIGNDSEGINPSSGTVTLLLRSNERGGGFGSQAYGVDSSNYSYANSELQRNLTYEYEYNVEPKEKALVLPRTLTNSAGFGPNDCTDIVNNQGFWLLSKEEVEIIGGTGSTILPYADTNSPSSWWLRSRTSLQDEVTYQDTFDSLVENVVQTPITKDDSLLFVRPALTLNLTNTILTAGINAKPIEAGKWATLDGIDVRNDELQFTVKDSSLTLANVSYEAQSDTSITFHYNASAEANSLAAIITDENGTFKLYGYLENNADGEATVAIPAGLESTDKLFILAEKINLSESLYTDFASDLQPIHQSAPSGLVSDIERIINTSSEMEYSLDNTTWYPCTPSQTTGLAAGKYYVRYQAKIVNGIAAVAPSEAIAVNITATSSPQDNRTANTSSPMRSNVYTSDSSEIGLWLSMLLLAILYLRRRHVIQ